MNCQLCVHEGLSVDPQYPWQVCAVSIFPAWGVGEGDRQMPGVIR